MKVVVDTNVLIAGLIAEGLCRDIIKRRLPAFELITSPALLAELSEKLSEKFGMEPGELPFLRVYKETATITKPCPLPQPVCRDADDDLVLATALTTKAEVIVTGDKDLLVLKSFQGIKILSPREFVEFLDAH